LPLTVTDVTVAPVTVAGTDSVGAEGGTVSLGTVAVVAGLTPAVLVAVAVKVTVPSLRLERFSVGRDQVPVELAVAVPLTVWPAPSDAVTFTVLAAWAVPETGTAATLARLTTDGAFNVGALGGCAGLIVMVVLAEVEPVVLVAVRVAV
jgi:hypothetical protein